MAKPCPKCGGVGRGRLEPDVGWIAGPLDETGQPAPCVDCEARFQVIIKDPKSMTILDETGKVERKLDPAATTLGVYIDPQKKKVPTKTVQSLDGGPISDGEGAPAEAFFSPQEIQAQVERDR